VGVVANHRHHGMTLSSVTFYLFAEALFEFLFHIERKLDRIMAEVKIDQAVLDADGDKLSSLADDLATLIASGNLSDADQSTLQAGIDKLTGLDTVTVTPPTT
jgi:hypothetical protein